MGADTPLPANSTSASEEKGPSASTAAPNSPRRSPRTKHKSPKSSRHSSAGSAEPIRQLPPLNLADIEKDPQIASSHQRHDSVAEQLCTYDSKEERTLVKEHAVGILIYLSGPVFLISSGNCFIALAVLFVLPFLLLFSFCHKEQSFRDLIMRMLAPLLRWQLELIYAAIPSSQKSESSTRSNSRIYTHSNAHISRGHPPIYQNDDNDPVTNVLSLPMVIIIHLLSPIVSIGVVIAAWVSAFFWFYAGILGNPEGAGAETQRNSVRYINGERPGEHDGRESVLAVRAWWKGWLTRAVEVRAVEFDLPA